MCVLGILVALLERNISVSITNISFRYVKI